MADGTYIRYPPAASGGLTGSVDLTNEIVGVLPVANGGTNASTALNNNRMIISSSGMLVEHSALSDGQLFIGKNGNAPVAAALTAGANITIALGSGSITISAASGSGSSTGSISLISGVRETLPIAFGGTNSSTTLVGNRTIFSLNSGIREGSALTDGQIFIGATSAAPIAAGLTAGSHIGVTTGSGSITIAVIGSISLVNEVVGSLPLSQTTGSISLVDRVSGNLPLTQTSGSLSLVNQVTGNLPLSQTSGSISLTNQVVNNLPLSQTSGSISLTAQVSGLLPLSQTSGVLGTAQGGTASSASLNNNRVVVTTGGLFREADALGDGQVLIGANGGSAPIPATLTAGTNVTIANGSNSITISATGGGVTGSISLIGQVSGVLGIGNGGTNSSTSLNNNRMVISSGGMLVEAGALTNGQIFIGSTGVAPVGATLTAGAGIGIVSGAGSITVQSSGSSIVSSISLTNDVTGVLPIANGGTNASTALNGNRIVISSGSGLREAGALTDGQLFIGATGVAPIGAAITSSGTNFSVTNGAGSILLTHIQPAAFVLGSTTSQISFILGNGQTTIPAGVQQAFVRVPQNMLITGWDIVAGSASAANSVVATVMRSTFASFPPTVGSSISGSTPPTLIGGTQTKQVSSTTFTTTQLIAGDYLDVSLSSVSAVNKVVINLVTSK